MAILNKIRQRSIFLIIIIALALFSFVLADVIQNGGFTSQKSLNTVATVNGTDISRDDFARKVDETLQRMGTNATNTQAVRSVWNTELRKVLLQEQLDNLGITLGEGKLRQALAQNFANDPTFQNEAGMFDYNRLQEFIAEAKEFRPEVYNRILQIEEQVAQNAKQQSYFNLIKAGLGATTLEGEVEYKKQNDKIDIEFVQIPYSSVADDEVSVSDDEIADYIKKHEEKYQTEKSVDIQYVLFKEEPSEEDEAVIKQEAENLLQKQVKYNSVTKKNDTIAGFKEIEEMEEAESFVNQNSDAPYADRWWFKKDLPEQVADTIFTMEKGDVYGPYKQGNSYLVSKVLDTKQLPDSTQAKHILLPWEGLQSAQNISRTKEETKKLADSLLAAIKRDGGKFEELAKEFSSDPSVADNNGDLGYLTPGSTVAPFDAYVFENKKGDKGVIETDFGYHVVVVEDQKNFQKAMKIANIVKQVEASEATLNNLFTTATKFESTVGNADFVETAKENNYEVRPVNKIGELEENIPGLGNNRSIITWAYDDDTETGNIKRFSTNNGYVIVQLTNKAEKGLMSVAEAASEVRPILINKKKAQLIKEKIKATSLEEIAQEQNTEVKKGNSITLQSPTIPEAGTEPKVVGTAYGLKEGSTSGLIEGKKGVYAVKLLAKREAEKTDDYTQYISEISKKRAASVNTKVVEALKKNATIEDRRANFY